MVGAVIGAVVGFAIGGPEGAVAGATWGFAIGDSVGTAIEGRQNSTQPPSAPPAPPAPQIFPTPQGLGQRWTNFATNPIVSHGASFVSGIVPFAGEVQDWAGATVGVDLITGEHIPGWQQNLSRVLLVVPFVGAVSIRQGGRALNKLIAEGRAAGKLSSDAIEGMVNAAEEIYVIGTRADTKVAKFWPRHVILDLPDNLWRPFINERWVQSIIDTGAPVYLASSLTVKNLWSVARSGPTMFGREARQLVKAGYRLVGDYLIKLR